MNEYLTGILGESSVLCPNKSNNFFANVELRLAVKKAFKKWTYFKIIKLIIIDHLSLWKCDVL